MIIVLHHSTPLTFDSLWDLLRNYMREYLRDLQWVILQDFWGTFITEGSLNESSYGTLSGTICVSSVAVVVGIFF